jgi:ABC-2 type transport system ATP-binding protein
LHSLELDGVDSGYGNQPVLHDISFRAAEPAIYVVLGANGAGKTTLFRTIAGILEPGRGRVVFDGEDLAESSSARKKINYLSHYNALPEEMTVRGALDFYAKIEGGSANEAVALLGLEELTTRRVSELSQGQKKRVSIAKVFLKERDMYLLDEPTSNLDPGVSKEIRDILIRLAKEKMVLYSSHNLYEARDVGTNLILIRRGAVGYFGKISDVRSKAYKVGFKTDRNISELIGAELEGEYYVKTFSSPDEAGLTLRELVGAGVTVTEMRELDNPLQSLFDGAPGEGGR